MGKVISTKIPGVKWEQLPIIPANGGCVLKMLLPATSLLPDLSRGFGELYFSEIEPGYVRAWKRHKKQNQLFCVPTGLIKIALLDARESSPSYGEALGALLGRPDHYRLLTVPAGIWYGFECKSSSAALICNFTDIPHDPEEIERKNLCNETLHIRWEDIRVTD